MQPKPNLMKVAAAVIERDGKVLVTRRKPGGLFGGFWEFPGGKIEPGEPPETALAREIFEELGLTIAVGDFLGGFPYSSADAAIELLAFRAVVRSGEVHLADHDAFLWAQPDTLDPAGFSPADRPLLLAMIHRGRI